MSRKTGAWWDLVAAAAVAVLLPAAAGTFPFRDEHPPGHGSADARFHAGKREAGGNVDPACGGKGCHAPVSHRKGGGAAAFLNMHEEYVSCLACHGKDRERRWTSSPSGAGRGMRLSYPAGDRGGAPHDAIDAPAACERCHSETGMERISQAGWKALPQGFASPIPLRMLREGGRKWVPEDIP